jgi:organic radical activating enzyme
MYHTLESVHDLHVEITNRCNAACPMCARNDFGGATKSDLDLDEWSKQDIDNIFAGQFPNLENVMFCGTHGDPCVAKHTLYAMERIKSTSDATVEFYSNASMRSKDWWADLGSMLQEKKPHHKHYRRNDLAIFSVDGEQTLKRLWKTQKPTWPQVALLVGTLSCSSITNTKLKKLSSWQRRWALNNSEYERQVDLTTVRMGLTSGELKIGKEI